MKVTDLSVPKPTLICTFRYAERKELTTQKKLKYSFVCLANKMPCFLSFLSSTFFAFLPFLPIWNAKQFCGWLGHLLSAFVDSQLSSNSKGTPTLKAWSDQHPAYTLSPPTLIHFNVDSHRRARPRLAGSVHIQTQRAACRPYKANRRALLPAVVAFNVSASHSFTTLYYSTGPKREESFGHSTDGILPISIPHDMGHS